MHSSKLIELLREMDAKQLSRFETYLASPYFNKNNDKILFFNFLKKYAPSFSHKNLQKKTVIDQLKLEKQLDERTLAYLMSDLTRLIEDFLSVEHYLDSTFDPPLHLLEQLHGIQLPRHYNTVEQGLRRLMEKTPLRNALFYRQALVFKNIRYEHQDPNVREFNEKLQEAANALDRYFIVEKLRYACEMQNLSNMFESEYRQPFLSQVLDWSADPVFEEDVAIQLYRQLLILLKDPNRVEYFDPVKSLLIRYTSCFERREVKQLYTLLLNYCTRRINRFNDERYWNEYLEINKLLLENEMLLEHGSLPPWRFTNLVTVGLRTGQTEWTFDFMQKYRNKLPQQHAENIYRYNLGHYYYHVKDFDKAQKELIRVTFTDVLLNVTARSLLIKIYFESDQSELLHAYLEATRIFLLRNTVLDDHIRQQLKKFVEYCTKMAKASDRKKIVALLDALPPAREIMHRKWLVEQLERKGNL